MILLGKPYNWLVIIPFSLELIDISTIYCFFCLDKILNAVQWCQRSRILFYEQLAQILLDTPEISDEFINAITERFQNNFAEEHVITDTTIVQWVSLLLLYSDLKLSGLVIIVWIFSAMTWNPGTASSMNQTPQILYLKIYRCTLEKDRTDRLFQLCSSCWGLAWCAATKADSSRASTNFWDAMCWCRGISQIQSPMFWITCSIALIGNLHFVIQFYSL